MITPQCTANPPVYCTDIMQGDNVVKETLKKKLAPFRKKHVERIDRYLALFIVDLSYIAIYANPNRLFWKISAFYFIYYFKFNLLSIVMPTRSTESIRKIALLGIFILKESMFCFFLARTIALNFSGFPIMLLFSIYSMALSAFLSSSDFNS